MQSASFLPTWTMWTLSTSQFQNRSSPPRVIPRHLTYVKAPYSVEFDPKWGPPSGAFGFRVKPCASDRKQKDFAHAPSSRVIPHGFFVVVVYDIASTSTCIVISWNMPLFKVWSVDKLNKKFGVAENFAELVSKGIKAIIYSNYCFQRC